MAQFNAGDIVECIDTGNGNDIVVGQRYRVVELQAGGLFVSVEKLDGSDFRNGRRENAFYARRFKKDEQPVATGGLKVGDKVKLSRKYHSGKPLAPGLEYDKVYTITRTSFPTENRVGISGDDNGGIGWYTERFEKVEEQPVATVEAPFKVGDTVVIKDDSLGAIFNAGETFTVTKVSEEDGWVHINHQRWSDAPFRPSRFRKLGEEKPVKEDASIDMESTGAMSFGIARQLRQRIIDEAGISKDSIRLDTRSWDNEGRFAAIVIETTLKQTSHRFVHPRQVAEYLSSQKPIDVTPYRESARLGVKVYQFRSPITNQVFRMNGTEWFTEADIKNAGGTVIHEGKRYRPGRNQFVPFVDSSK